MSSKLERFIPLIFALIVLLMLFIGGSTYHSFSQSNEARLWENHTQEILLRVENIFAALVDAETGVRGFMLTGETEFLAPYQNGTKQYSETLPQIRALTRDNPLQQQRVNELEKLGAKKLQVMQQNIDLRRASGLVSNSVTEKLVEGKQIMDQIRVLVAQLKREESDLLEIRKTTLRTQTNYLLLAILTGSILGIVSLSFANFTIVRQLKHRRLAEEALAKANAQLEQQYEEQSANLSKTSDELRVENVRRAIAEKKEREQREWWRVTLHSIGDCVITTDTEGKINYINEKAQEVTGWSEEEAHGLPLETVFHIVNEDSLQPVESPIVKVLREGIIVGLANHTSLITKSGNYIPIDDSGAPIRDDDGTIVGAVLVFRDFSLQRQVESSLRESEERYRLVAENASDAIIIIDDSSTILFINKAAERIFGHRIEQMTGQALTKLMPEYLRHVHAAGLTQYIEIPGLHRDGHEISLELSFSESRFRGRHVFIGIARDVSERRLTEQKLRESEHFNRSIFESSPDCVKILELDGRLHSMNTNGLCLMEIEDFQPFIGKQWLEFWQGADQLAARHALEAAAKGEAGNFQGYCVTAKGTSKWWDVSVAPILNAEGKPIRIVSTSRDITDRKRQQIELQTSEIRFRTLTETIPQLVWTCRPNGLCGYLSNRWMEYTGTTLEQNLGYGWLNCLHPDDAAPTQEAWAQAVANSTSFQTEFRLRRADGEYRWHLSRAVQVRDEAGNIVKWFGTSTDIEDHKKAEAERSELLEREQLLRSKAEEANRLKDEFVATVSHELRTPLNAILGWARMMRGGKLDATTTSRAVETIERSAENQARLIDDLLDVSRIITGKLRLDIKTIAPEHFIRAALETIAPAAQAKEISIQADLDLFTNAIFGDANRLQQVAWNLLSNAIKFTPKGGQINVRLSRDDSHVILSISDNGQGISADFLPHVFDRFRQADATSIRKHGGLGLGLSIARHLVELHGGLIAVESEGENQGATFTVRLPIRPLRIPESDQPSNTISSLANNNQNQPEYSFVPILGGLFIVTVDDEEDARQLLTQLLTTYGATVVSADSVPAALEIIKHQQPDVLVSDIGMPREDGYSLIRKVREYELNQGHPRRVPAIALTAYASSRDRMMALAAGFNHHVPKPVEPTELITVIASLTGRLNDNEPDA